MSVTVLPVAVLAGGLATRLRPMTETMPKALIDINGAPFIAHQLRLLRAHGITRVVLCVGYLGEMIREVIGEGEAFDLQVAYAFDGPTLLGTAGSLKRALPLLGNAFFVLYGDAYLDCDYRAVQATFERSDKPALMAVFRNEGQWDTSNVELVAGRIVAYDKWRQTERMRHIDYGLGVLTPAVFDAVPADEPADLAAVYHSLVTRGALAAHEVDQRFYEVGSYQGIQETRRFLALKGRQQELTR